jgi:hypothetical protein
LSLYVTSSPAFQNVALTANELHVLPVKRKLIKLGGMLIRLVASCLLVIAVSAACENSTDPLLGFPGGGGGAVTPAQASGNWSMTLTRTTTLGCTGAVLANGSVLTLSLAIQGDGSAASSSTWRSPPSGAVLPLSGSVNLTDGATDLILTSGGSTGMELRGTMSSTGTFTGTITDPAPGFTPVYGTTGCEYSAPGSKT